MAPDCAVRLGRVLFIIFEFDGDEEWDMIEVWTDTQSDFAEPHKKPALPWPGTGSQLLQIMNFINCLTVAVCKHLHRCHVCIRICVYLCVLYKERVPGGFDTREWYCTPFSLAKCLNLRMNDEFIHAEMEVLRLFERRCIQTADFSLYQFWPDTKVSHITHEILRHWSDLVFYQEQAVRQTELVNSWSWCCDIWPAILDPCN